MIMEKYKAVSSGLRETLSNIIRPFCTLLAFLRYHDIWEIRNAIIAGNKSKILSMAYWGYFAKKGSYLGLNTKMKGPVCFPHGVVGIFISNGSIIGKNCVIFQQVTIGSNEIKGSNLGSPVIGDNCYIGAGAKIIGNIHIGNNCRIGAGAVVYQDMEDNSVAVAERTRIIKKDEVLDNHYYKTINNESYYYEDGYFVKSNMKG